MHETGPRDGAFFLPGAERTLTAAGSSNTAIVMRSGATAELNSGLSNDQALIVANAPGVLKTGGKPLVSAELYVVVDVRKRATDTEANVPFRGVEPAAFQVRDNVEIVQRRMFETGKNEIVVGRAAQREFQGLDVGQTIRFGQTDWQVVGTFEADGSVSESELWTDVRVLQNAYHRGKLPIRTRQTGRRQGSEEAVPVARHRHDYCCPYRYDRVTE